MRLKIFEIFLCGIFAIGCSKVNSKSTITSSSDSLIFKFSLPYKNKTGVTKGIVKLDPNKKIFLIDLGEYSSPMSFEIVKISGPDNFDKKSGSQKKWFFPPETTNLINITGMDTGIYLIKRNDYGDILNFTLTIEK